jgi:hypothetical protein
MLALAAALTARVALALAVDPADGTPMRHTSPMSTLATRLFNVCSFKMYGR